MKYQNLTIEKDKQTCLVTLNRPERLNAIDRTLHLEILQVCDELKNDDDIRAVIWTGAGRGFCAGADLTGNRPSGDSQERQNRLDEFQWVGRQALAIYRKLDKPSICAINGVAAGAGMSLALACDMRVGCENSRFRTVFIERSLSPDSGMSYFLPRIVGASRALDLIFTSRTVAAEEAYRIGLLDRLTTSDNLLEESMALAKQIAFWPPVAMQVARRVLQHSQESTLEEQLKYETHGLVFARRAPHDVEEASASFLERREPLFTGE